MAFGPIPSWKIEGEKVKGMTDFLFLGAEITADGDWSHEVRRWLLLGREAMPKPDSMLKSKDIIFLTKVCIFKAMVFPVVTYGCESWIIKKAELQRIWCLWNVVLENILENPLESKETKPINLKGSQLCILIGRTDAEAKIPIFGHLMIAANSLEKTLMLGKIEGTKVRECQRMKWVDVITDTMGMNLGKLQEMWGMRRPAVLHTMGSQRVWHDWAN